MERPICFRIFMNYNFGNFEIKVSKRNKTLEQPDTSRTHTHIPTLTRTTSTLQRVTAFIDNRHKLPCRVHRRIYIYYNLYTA